MRIKHFLRISTPRFLLRTKIKPKKSTEAFLANLEVSDIIQIEGLEKQETIILSIINLFVVAKSSNIFCIKLSKYQLVRCGWGATLPATLYPAIYYVAVGHILAGTIKTINYLLTGYKLRFRRDYN
jgi:hypothetical protein